MVFLTTGGQIGKKPCIVEYFDKNGIKKFETRSSVKPDGGAGGSRSNPQHSVTIEPAKYFIW